ncbi:MAG: methyltransferase regulatory domain-containing protein [Chloroflexi bacterium]|nr:methyltransferase regulatory domain-containing protein [Chloroflexota bacterium]
MPGEPRRNEYDRVPYPAMSIAYTHPDWMAVVAALFGVDGAPAGACRVLELGCGSGMNLIPMASGLPGSTFLGIDYTRRHIEEADAAVAEIGLANIRFAHADILSYDFSGREFDYIVCHGVYSWVPEAVRERVLAIFEECLAPDGVAYLSYNTYPGWHSRRAIRDALLFHTRHIDDPVARAEAAVEFVQLLSDAMPADSSTFGFHLHNYRVGLEERRQRGSERLAFMLHDELNDVNEPFYLHEVVEAAARHGLAYLADSEFQASMPGKLPPVPAEQFAAASNSPAELQQYIDFVQDRAFRRSLFARAGPASRGQLALRGDLLGHVRLRSGVATRMEVPLEAGVPVAFAGVDGGMITLDQPATKAAFLCLADAHPRSITLDELLERVVAKLEAAGIAIGPEDGQRMASDLMKAFLYSARLVTLQLHDFQLDVSPGDRPRASRSARYAAGKGRTEVTNLLHESVPLDPMSVFLLPLADGTRTRADIADAIEEMVAQGKITPDPSKIAMDHSVIRATVETQLDQTIAAWGRMALLEP